MIELHEAVEEGDLHRVRQLLSSQYVNVNECLSEDGDTPLHLACRNNLVDIVKELLQHPDINVDIKSMGDLPDDVTSNHVIKIMIRDHRNATKRTHNKNGQQENSNDVDEFLYYEMAKIIGLDKVKENMNEIVETLKFLRKRKSEGLGNDDEMPDLNMVFLGNPGTGKTSIARIIPKLLHKMGMLPRGDVFVEAVRNDLVGQYIGKTAPKTKKVIDQARGGVLFVDEAYQLMPPDSSRDFGREALETIMSEMVNASIDPDRRVVFIFAGYRKDMDRLLNANEGMRRRIQYFFEFEDYTPEQLADIMCKKVTSKKDYILAPSLVNSLPDIMETEFSKEVRSKYNGGLVDKLLQFSKQKMKSRVVEIKKPTKEDLQTITKEDVLQAIRENRF